MTEAPRTAKRVVDRADGQHERREAPVSIDRRLSMILQNFGCCLEDVQGSVEKETGR